MLSHSKIRDFSKKDSFPSGLGGKLEECWRKVIPRSFCLWRRHMCVCILCIFVHCIHHNNAYMCVLYVRIYNMYILYYTHCIWCLYLHAMHEYIIYIFVYIYTMYCVYIICMCLLFTYYAICTLCIVFVNICTHVCISCSYVVYVLCIYLFIYTHFSPLMAASTK